MSSYYKVKIKNTDCNNLKSNYEKIDFGAFFGKNNDFKISFYKSIEIAFISPHKVLREKIKEYFPIFIAVNNFGFRNNKGYGHFKIKDIDDKNVISDIEKYKFLEDKYFKTENDSKCNDMAIGIYKIEVKKWNKDRKDVIKNILDEVKLFHQILKSGYNLKLSYNQQNIYIPSMMLKESKEFIENKDIIFEKKAFKLFLSKSGYDISKLTENGDIKGKIYYVRGLLGLPPFYSFSKPSKVVFNIKINKIERFTSPITYIPIPKEQSFIIIVNYGKIQMFRERANNVDFSIKVDNKSRKFRAIIPNEKEYSIHCIFKKGGVIDSFLKKCNSDKKNDNADKNIMDLSKSWKYSIISDTEVDKK